MLPLLAVPPDRAPDVEDLWFLLHLLFERMWNTASCIRDLDEITSRNRKLAARFADLLRRVERTVLELCEAGRARARCTRASARSRALAANVALVATYWMSFQRVGAPPARRRRDARARPRRLPGARAVRAVPASATRAR